MIDRVLEAFSQWQRGLVEWLKGRRGSTSLDQTPIFIEHRGVRSSTRQPRQHAGRRGVHEPRRGLGRGNYVSRRLSRAGGHERAAQARRGASWRRRRTRGWSSCFALDVDEGRVPGEFAIGPIVASPFMRQTLFDEKIAGTPWRWRQHRVGRHKPIAVLGQVCDLRPGGEIRVDGELLHKNGEFVVKLSDPPARWASPCSKCHRPAPPSNFGDGHTADLGRPTTRSPWSSTKPPRRSGAAGLRDATSRSPSSRFRVRQDVAILADGRRS
jgi:hypothetical protein